MRDGGGGGWNIELKGGCKKAQRRLHLLSQVCVWGGGKITPSSPEALERPAARWPGMSLTHKKICSSNLHRTRLRPPTHGQTKIAIIRRTQPSFIWDVVILALWRRINTSSRRAKHSGELTRLKKQRDSDGVCVCVCLYPAARCPSLTHVSTHTHTYWPSVGTLVDRWWCHCLLLSNYQVHYPCNMPIMWVFFFLSSLCVCLCAGSVVRELSLKRLRWIKNTIYHASAWCFHAVSHHLLLLTLCAHSTFFHNIKKQLLYT